MGEEVGSPASFFVWPGGGVENNRARQPERRREFFASILSQPASDRRQPAAVPTRPRPNCGHPLSTVDRTSIRLLSP